MAPTISRFVVLGLALLAIGPDARAGDTTLVEWTISAVDGAAPEGDPMLTFGPNGTVAGSTGCNRFRGQTEQNGDIIRFGPLASTKMQCPGTLGAQERSIFELLSRPLGVRYNLVTDQVTLTGNGGRTMLLERSK